MHDIRCSNCNKLLLRVDEYTLLKVKCSRCKTVILSKSRDYPSLAPRVPKPIWSQKMALTVEEHNDYHEIIQAIFGGTVGSTPDQVNEEVADIVDQVIDEIYECSQGMVVADALLNFWFPQASFRALASTTKTAIQDLMKVNQGFRYTLCANATRLNWKSALTIALMGPG
ncbi:hypothetical protein [Halomonas sp. WWR20]